MNTTIIASMYFDNKKVFTKCNTYIEGVDTYKNAIEKMKETLPEFIHDDIYKALFELTLCVFEKEVSHIQNGLLEHTYSSHIIDLNIMKSFLIQTLYNHNVKVYYPNGYTFLDKINDDILRLIDDMPSNYSLKEFDEMRESLFIEFKQELDDLGFIIDLDKAKEVIAQKHKETLEALERKRTPVDIDDVEGAEVDE